MTDRPRVLVLAAPDDGAVIEEALAEVDCDGRTASDLFDAIAALDDFEPDAVIIDLRMQGDVGLGFGHWVRDHDAHLPMIGLVDVNMGPEELARAPACDELCLNPPQDDELRRLIARARGEDVATPEPDAAGRGNAGLTVKVSADLFEVGDTDAPPEGGLLVGAGKDAHHPDFHEVAEDYAHYDDWFGEGADDEEPPALDADDEVEVTTDDDGRPRVVVHEENLADRAELLRQLRQLSS